MWTCLRHADSNTKSLVICTDLISTFCANNKDCTWVVVSMSSLTRETLYCQISALSRVASIVGLGSMLATIYFLLFHFVYGPWRTNAHFRNGDGESIPNGLYSLLWIHIYIYIYILSLTQFFTYTKKERKKMSKKTEGEILHLWAHQKFIKHKKKPSYFMNY